MCMLVMKSFPVILSTMFIWKHSTLLFFAIWTISVCDYSWLLQLADVLINSLRCYFNTNMEQIFFPLHLHDFMSLHGYPLRLSLHICTMHSLEFTVLIKSE